MTTASSMRLRFLVILLAIAATACSDAGPGPASFVKRDSAGVEIVENELPDSARVAWWSLERPAMIDIGNAVDDPAHALAQVTAAARLSDGRVVVAGGGTADIRYFAADGSHLRTAGRRGNGPGEFQRPTDIVVLPGDSLLVIDAGLRRTSILDPQGAFVRSASMPPAPGQPNRFPAISDRFADGTYAAVRASTGSGPVNGRVRARQTFTRLSADRTEMNTIATVPGNERMVRTQTANGEVTAVSIFVPPFAKHTLHSASGDRLYVVTQDAPQVDVYAQDGTLARIIRTGHSLQPVTEEKLSKWIEDFVSTLPTESQKDRRESMRSAPAPAFFPPYRAMQIDPSRNLWLQDYDDRAIPAGDWNVFDPDGQLIARVRMPPGITVQEIGADYVLGVERDELDVEHVRLYSLRKGAGQ